eukprot:c15790_g1_i2 orf=97-1515(-)
MDSPPEVLMAEENPAPSVSLPALPPELQNSQYGIGTDARSSSSHFHLTLILAVGIAITAIALLLLFLLILLIRKKKKELEKPKNKVAGLPFWNKDLILSPQNPLKKWRKGHSTMFRRFKYKEILKATGDFSTIIGRGGFGTVYKARFQDGLVAAVKRMNSVSRQSEREFCKEMEFLGRLHHRHLVNLKGFCMEKHERFLIYEYMENGSLKEHLRGDSKTLLLNWQARLKVAIDVAAALEYLHYYCDPPLCHRDIKSGNILLDENFVAKVADFGLAHVTPSATSRLDPVNTAVRGTPGYMDPEYAVTQQLTEKSDLYSYGVLLLELITGRRAVQDNRNLVEWAQPYLGVESRILQMLDPDLESTCNVQELRSLAVLVNMCTQKEGKLRPNIRQVLRFLQDKLDMDRLSAVRCSSLIISAEITDSRVASPANLNISDEMTSFNSVISPNTPLPHYSKSFRFDTTPVMSPVSDQG